MDFAATLLLGLICIVIGVLLGALIFNRPGKTAADPLLERAAPQTDKAGVILRRDRRSQHLSVELDGDLYQSAGQLSPDRRRVLTHLAADFSTWLGILPSSQPGQPSESEPKVEQTSPAVQPDVEAAPKPERAAGSIAAQIDEILQDRLEGTPLEGRGIKILELPGQGMVVMVGLDKYTDLEQIADPDVRRVIRDAVAGWEARNTLKK
jgi:hypothetical protein